MRHRVYGRHLSRDKNERTALFRGLIRNLILHDSIETTESKAKAIKGLVDRLVAKSKDDSQASKRVVLSFLPQADIVKKLQEDIVPRFGDRASGFTQITKLGRRLGDGAMIVKMNFIDGKAQPKESKVKNDLKKDESVELDLESKTAESMTEEEPKAGKKVRSKKEGK